MQAARYSAGDKAPDRRAGWRSSGPVVGFVFGTATGICSSLWGNVPLNCDFEQCFIITCAAIGSTYCDDTMRRASDSCKSPGRR